MTWSAGSSRADAEPSEADRHHRATHGRWEDLLLRDQGRLRGQNVGYSIDPRMKASLAVPALRSAITRPEPADTVVHSDGDSQFRSNAFVRTRRTTA
jgi:transposase InsO family protein